MTLKDECTPAQRDELIDAIDWIRALIRGGGLYAAIAEKIGIHERTCALMAMDDSFTPGPVSAGRVIYAYRLDRDGDKSVATALVGPVDADGKPFGKMK